MNRTLWLVLSVILCLAPGLGAQEGAVREPAVPAPEGPAAESAAPPAAPPKQPPPDQLKRELQQVLASPEFVRYRRREDLLQQTREELGQLGRRIMAALPKVSRGVWQPLAWFLIVAAAASLLAILLYRFVVSRLKARAAPGPPPAVIPPQFAARDPADLQRQAARLAEAGSFREAIRLLYLSALVQLHRARLLTQHEVRTNWEALRAMGGRPAVHEPLSHLTAIVDRVWYGHQPAARDDYDRCQDFARAVWRAAPPA